MMCLDLCKELPIRRRVYKSISKPLEVPWNTVKAIINKGRQQGTIMTFQMKGHLSKIDGC